MKTLGIKVEFDKVNATKGLTELQKDYKNLKTTLSSVSREIKENGDYVNGNGDKMVALTKLISNQETELKEYQERLSKVNTETKDGRQEQEKLSSIISSVKANIASYNSQLKRTQEQLDLAQNGVVALRKSYEQQQSELKSLIELEEAQGNKLTAQRTKMMSLKESFSSLQTIESKEKDNLSRLSNARQEAITSYQRQIEYLKMVKNSLGEESSEYTEARTKLLSYKNELNNSNTAYSNQVTRLNEVRTTLAKNANEYKTLSNTVGSASTSTTLKYDAMTKAANNMTTSGKKWISTAQSMASVTLTLGTALYSGLQTSIKLENTYKTTTNLLTTGGEKLSEAQSSVNEMYKNGETYSLKYGKSMTSISEGYQTLVKRGYSSKQALSSLESELQASVASGDDFNDVVSVTSQTLESFGLKANSVAKMTKNTKKVVNELAYAADATSTSFSSEGKAMEYVGASAHNAGISLSETSSAIGILSNNGLEAEKSGTGLRKVINEIANQADTLKSKYGITVTDAKGNLLSLTNIMQQFHDKTESMSSSDKSSFFNAIFGTTGQQAGEILSENYKSLGKLTEKVQEAGEKQSYVAELSSKNMKSAQNQLKVFKQSWTALTYEFSSNLLPAITKVTTGLAGLIEDVSNAPKWVKETAAWGTAFLALAAPVAAVVGSVKLLSGWVTSAAANVGILPAKFKSASAQSVASLEAIQTELTALNETLAETDTLAANTSLTTKTSTLGTVAAEAETATGETAALNSKLATTVETSATGATAAASWGTKAVSWIGKISTALIALPTAIDLGESIYSSITSNSSTTKITAASKVAGTTIGGVIGGVLGSVIPGAGTVTGAALGASIGEQLGGTKTAQNWTKAIKKSLTKATTETEKEQTANLGVAYTVSVKTKTSKADLKKTANAAVKQLNSSFKESKAKANVDEKSLSSSMKKAVSNVNKQFSGINAATLKMRMSTDNTSLNKTYSTLSSYYSKLETVATNSITKRENKEKEYLKEQLNDNQITQSRYNELVSSLEKKDTSRVNSAKNNLEKLKSNEESAYKQLSTLNSNHEKEITTIKNNASKQRQTIASNEQKAYSQLESDGYITINNKTYKGEAAKKAIKKEYAEQEEELEKSTNKKITKSDSETSEERKKIVSSLAKSRLATEKKLGEDIAGALTSSSKKQQAILKELSAAKGKISTSEAKELISESTKATNTQVTNAETQYQKTKSSAEKTAKETIANAKKMHDDDSSYSTSEMNTAIANAKTKRDSVIEAAKTERDQTVATAKDQHKKIVKEIDGASSTSTTKARSTVKDMNKAFAKLNNLTFKIGLTTDKSSMNKVKTQLSAVYKQIESLSKNSVNERKKVEASYFKEEYKNGDISKAKYKSLMKSLESESKKRVASNKSDLNNLKNNESVTEKQIEALNKSHEKTLESIRKSASSKRKSLKKQENSAINSIENSGYVEIKGKVYRGESGILAVKKLYASKRNQVTKNANKKEQQEDSSNSKTRTNIIKSFAKSRVAQEKKLGVDVAGQLTSSAKKQKAILTTLKNDKGKISDAEVAKALTNSAKEANKQISNANKTYEKTKTSAENTANKKIEQAKWAYKNVSGYTKSEMDDAITHAKNERDTTIEAARIKKKDTVEYAKQQNKNVKDYAESESKSVTTHAQKSAKNGVWTWNQHVSLWSQATNKLAKFWNKVTKLFGGTTMDTVAAISTVEPAIAISGWATGTGTLTQSQVALVGEAGPELAYEPYSGKARILGAGGATFAQINAGEQILNANDTEKVLSGKYSGKLPAYASGTSTATDFLSSIVKKAESFVGTVSSDVTNVLKSPAEYLTNLYKNMDYSDSGEAGTSMLKGITNGIESTFTNAFKEIYKSLSGDSDNPSGSGVSRWKPVITKVANNMDVSLTDAQMSKILWRINKESGGDPTIQNNWDSNAKAGHPSIGLLQYIQPTFKHWLPSSSDHSYPENIKHGASQIAAMFNDTNWYKDISVSGGWGPTGHKRFANGGLSTTHQMAEISEDDKAEMILPLTNTNRTIQLMQQALSYISGNTSSSSTTSSSSDTSSTTSQVITAMETMAQQFNKLLSVNSAQLDAINNNGWNKKNVYNRTALDQQIASFQMLGE